jgi:hypothetical protein
MSPAKKDFRRLEEIYAVFGRKSLPSGENFNCSVICSNTKYGKTMGVGDSALNPISV